MIEERPTQEVVSGTYVYTGSKGERDFWRPATKTNN